jgi:hypothetical protein
VSGRDVANGRARLAVRLAALAVVVAACATSIELLTASPGPDASPAASAAGPDSSALSARGSSASPSDGGLASVLPTAGGTGAAGSQGPEVTSPAPTLAPTKAPAPTPGGTSAPTPARTSAPTHAPTPTPAATAAPIVLVGAGDIASCGLTADSDTARLIEGIAGTVFTAGDNAYEQGTAAQFQDCYDPTWGAFRDRTRPTPGNHDWGTGSLSAYLAYFGSSAVNANGDPWYAYGLGGWRIIALDSDCGNVGGCDASSPEGRWLTSELASNPASCTIAIWHHPRFSSGEHGGTGSVDFFWKSLVAAGTELVINGHDHDYERFAALGSGGAPLANGTIEIVAGTGGASLRDFKTPVAGSTVRRLAHGVLELRLSPDSVTWRFIEVGGAIGDSGSAACH